MMSSHCTSVITMEQHLKLAHNYIGAISTIVDDLRKEMVDWKDKQEEMQNRLSNLELVHLKVTEDVPKVKTALL